MILYFHGFGSHGKSWKVELLRKHLPSVTIISPTLPVDPVDIVNFAEDEMSRSTERTLLVGSSLGGFYAYCFAMLHNLKAVILNPAMTPWIQLIPYIGINTRNETGEIFEWKREYLDHLKKMNDNVIGQKTPHSNLHFFLSTDDESLDHTWIKESFHDAGSILFLDNCKHRFNRFVEIIPVIKKLHTSLEDI